jgi:hypothetical protein
LLTFADTTIFRDNVNAGQNFGSSETMLVENGPLGNNEILSAFSMVEFFLSGGDVAVLQGLPSPTATLCLTHVENTEPERTVTYTICKVAPVASGVEFATGSDVLYQIPDDCEGGKTAEFGVTPSQGEVCVDVTELLADTQFTSDMSIPFMIDDLVESETPGDRFYTKEDPEGRQPKLTWTGSRRALIVTLEGIES